MTAPTDTPSPTADEAKTAGWIGALAVGGLLFLLGTVSVRMVVVVLVIAAVVFMHELGHYITAKWTGMKATEFFLGFGPRIFSFRRGETEFGLKPILAGAYVKIIGMTNLEEVDPEDEPRTYRQQSYPRRVLVASAGSLMHFAMALLLIPSFVTNFWQGAVGGHAGMLIRRLWPFFLSQSGKRCQFQHDSCDCF